MIFPSHRLLFLFFLLLKTTGSERKSPKRTKDSRHHLPKYDLHQEGQLIPSDVQVTIFLQKNKVYSFEYRSTMNGGALSVTVVTCSSPVSWIFDYEQHNNNTAARFIDGFLNGHFGPQTIVTKDFQTKSFRPFAGLYSLLIGADGGDTYVHIYVSTENGGPQALQNANRQNIRLKKRYRKRRLAVKWEPSRVDPQSTDYCLVVSSTKRYRSLCSADAEKYGIKKPNSSKIPEAASQTIINYHHSTSFGNSGKLEESSLPLIACVGRRTHYTVVNLKQHERYYFDLFAVNRQSNFTYPFGSITSVFNSTIKPISVKDGRSSFVNLRKYDGKVVFRYKVGRNNGKQLSVYVIPCGVFVNVEISLKGKSIMKSKPVERFDKIIIESPVKGGRYNIKVSAVNREDIERFSGVEVYVSSKPSTNLPVLTMPEITKLKEYESLRTCNSVTIGWVPPGEPKVGSYCFKVKEGKFREPDEYGIPNHCGVDNRLKKNPEFQLTYCKDIEHNKSVLMEKIEFLKSGKNYIVQVNVKRHKGRSFSYDLLQVHTKTCHKS